MDVNVSASKFKHISKTYLLEFSLDVFYSFLLAHQNSHQDGVCLGNCKILYQDGVCFGNCKILYQDGVCLGNCKIRYQDGVCFGNCKIEAQHLLT